MTNTPRTVAEIRRIVRSLRQDIYENAEIYRFSGPHVYMFLLPTLRDHLAACRAFNAHKILDGERGHTPPGKSSLSVTNAFYTWVRPRSPNAGFLSFTDQKLAEKFREAMQAQGRVETYLCTATARATESVRVTSAQGQERTIPIYYKLC